MKHLLISLLVLTSISWHHSHIDAIAFSNRNVQQDTVKKPTVTLEEVTVNPMTILVKRDTATTIAAIGPLLNKGYGEIFTCINQNGLTPGKVMAFYYSAELPFIIESAVEVNKLPNQTTGRVRINKITGGNAIVAHYKGPYEQVSIAYTTINNWLKEHNKISNGILFEVYLNDPVSVKDPFELRTDVYQLVK